MLKIDQNYLKVAENLEERILAFTKKAKKIENLPYFLQRLYSTFDRQDKIASIEQECHSLLDRIEKIPVIFSDDESKVFEQKKCYTASLKAARIVIGTLSSSRGCTLNQLNKLMQKVAGLQYRIEAPNGGLNIQDIDAGLTDKLCQAALLWKKNHHLIQKKQLSSFEIKKLEEASRYPEFSHILLTSEQLQESFFSWSLRDNNSIREFIEFPATCSRIKSAFIASRVGRLGGDMLRIEKNTNDESGLIEKTLNLPFFINGEKKFVSILDESKILELNNGWQLSINEIFTIFSKKNKSIGNIELFASTGITNWNSHEIGEWNPQTLSHQKIDLTKDEWWDQLPVLEEVTKEVLESRMEDVLKNGEWVAYAKSARTTPDLDLDGCHGYLEIAIPTEKGTYKLYPFGNFASLFPTSPIELVQFVANTLKGKVAYPDENFFYSHRQQATHQIKISEDQGKALMHTIQKELIKARFGHVIFQFAGENCAFWSQKVLRSLDKKMPDFYKLNFLESKPLNPALKFIFDALRNLPIRMQPGAIRVVDTLLGSGRGIQVFEYHEKVYKSHKQGAVRNEFVIYQPGNLHVQILNGKIKGVISTGCC